MSFYQGTTNIAGHGATPYINQTTGNWELSGKDTGVQAIPIKISSKDFQILKANGFVDENKMYYITDSYPILIDNYKIDKSAWTVIGDRYETFIPIHNLVPTDLVTVTLSSALSDDQYILQQEECSSNPFIRITNKDGKIRILVDRQPDISINVDIVVTKVC